LLSPVISGGQQSIFAVDSPGELLHSKIGTVVEVGERSQGDCDAEHKKSDN
jgi:hypothetical protein